MPPTPTLTGPLVTLEPLQAPHAEALWPAAADPEVWRFMPQQVRTRDDLDRFIAHRLEPVTAGRAHAFLQRETATGIAVGTTSLFDIDPQHRRMEIGWTWLGRPWWRTGINGDAKRLLLTFAFERLGANRVQIRTDLRNVRAQRAIEALGAVREGILRQHDVLPDGHVRDVALYSIIASEWPAVQARLAARDGVGSPPTPQRPEPAPNRARFIPRDACCGHPGTRPPRADRTTHQ